MQVVIVLFVLSRHSGGVVDIRQGHSGSQLSVYSLLECTCLIQDEMEVTPPPPPINADLSSRAKSCHIGD